MTQVTTESECDRLSSDELCEWAHEIELEAQDAWSNAELGALRRQLETIRSELSRRGESL
jgi:hypothetical protein